MSPLRTLTSRLLNPCQCSMGLSPKVPRGWLEDRREWALAGGHLHRLRRCCPPDSARSTSRAPLPLGGPSGRRSRDDHAAVVHSRAWRSAYGRGRPPSAGSGCVHAPSASTRWARPHALLRSGPPLSRPTTPRARRCAVLHSTGGRSHLLASPKTAPSADPPSDRSPCIRHRSGVHRASVGGVAFKDFIARQRNRKCAALCSALVCAGSIESGQKR